MNIEHGEKLFEFASFADWCNTAKSKFFTAKVSGDDVICVDRRGRLCGWGKHFMQARDEDTFPVEVYRLRADMNKRKQGELL